MNIKHNNFHSKMFSSIINKVYCYELHYGYEVPSHVLVISTTVYLPYLGMKLTTDVLK